jgi:hypothetical protein
LNPPSGPGTQSKEPKRLLLCRALLLGAIAGFAETLLVLATGAMRPAELGLNFILLVVFFGVTGLLWLGASRSSFPDWPGDHFLVLASVLLFAFRGCLTQCEDEKFWRIGVPVGILVLSWSALGWLRRTRPTRAAGDFILVATMAITLSALDFAVRDGNFGRSKEWIAPVVWIGLVGIITSLLVFKGWIAQIAWTGVLGLITVSWSASQETPLQIEPAKERTTALLPVDSGHPNVILVVLDTVRADHMSLHGYPRKTTPNLEALAKESLVFDHAIASGNYSLSTHASLFTGLLPSHHGAHQSPDEEGSGASVRRVDSALAEGVETLASRLRNLGFNTGGASANAAYLAPWTGLQTGFDVFDARRMSLMGYYPFSYPFLSGLFGPARVERQREGTWEGEVVTASGVRFAMRAREPFFLFLNYFDAHAPHLPRAGYVFRADGLGREAPSELAYDSEIAYLDAMVGELVTRLRSASLLDRSILIVTADHGEFFGEHGLTSHRGGAYEEVLHVPLLVRYPKTLRPARVAVPFGLHQAYGLVRDLVESRSIEWALAKAAPPQVLSQVWGRVSSMDLAEGARRLDPDANIVYLDKFKLIDSLEGIDELYDLAADPREERNLLDPATGETVGLYARMQAAVQKLPPARPGTNPDATAADLDALRALGYIGPRKPRGR